MNQIAMKPIAVGLDTTRRNIGNLPQPGGFPVVYKCGNCGGMISYWLREKEAFCHLCGMEIDWRVITYINSTQSDLIEAADQSKAADLVAGFVHLVNELNEERQFATTVYISEFEEPHRSEVLSKIGQSE